MRRKDIDEKILKEIESKLKSRHRELSDELLNMKGELANEVPQDLKDSLPFKEENEILEKLDSMEEDEILMIERALQRFADGDYGYCQECGEPISVERLRFRPFSVKCIVCKKKEEAKQDT